MRHTSRGHVTQCGWPPDTPTDHLRDPKWLSHVVELEDGQTFTCAGPAEPGTEVSFTVDYGDTVAEATPVDRSLDESIIAFSRTTGDFNAGHVQEYVTPARTLGQAFRHLVDAGHLIKVRTGTYRRA